MAEEARYLAIDFDMMMERIDKQLGAMERGFMLIEYDDMDTGESSVLFSDLKRLEHCVSNINDTIYKCMERNKKNGRDLVKRYKTKELQIQFKNNILKPGLIVNG